MMERLILRPFDSLIFRQFLKELVISACIGIEEIVWSQFSTFKVVRDKSLTVPSELWLGISIQSPTWIKLFADTWMPATNPRIESLNTKRSTAVKAPKPEMKKTGDLLSMMDKMKMIPKK